MEKKRKGEWREKKKIEGERERGKTDVEESQQRSLRNEETSRNT